MHPAAARDDVHEQRARTAARPPAAADDVAARRGPLSMSAPVVSWVRDPVLPGFEAVTMPLAPVDDGALVATLVRRRSPRPNGRAVLYVHGFVDYFFHSHVAEAVVAQGWDLYAVDLRRSGRSLRTGNRPYFVRDLREYDAELTLAITVICAEAGHRALCLAGHSTGGLVAALYAHGGPERARVNALVLNSPFFDFKVGALERVALGVVSGLGGVVARLPIPGVLAPAYVQSLHRNFHGEWTFDLRWKPERGFPAYTGWFHAVREGQRRVQRGLALDMPVLLLRSARSSSERRYGDAWHTTDGVLDVAHMQRAVPLLGSNVRDVAIEGAVHDVFLSRPPVRKRALEAFGGWLAQLPVPMTLPAR
jgi:alpha-beta hydrolase superfamily lysophospholipase